ncbi:hypothetical protein K1719_016592 [Acacia pycnantha]|nr:hypothetical protein K1719_016592 [Acacia pycnantha]
MRRKKINRATFKMLKTQSPVKNYRRLSNICSNNKPLHLRDQPVRAEFPNTGIQAINKQEYDLANAKFALELAQKRPPQVPTPLLVTPANNPMDTPYIAKLEHVKHVLQIEPEFFFGTPNEVALKVFPSGFHFIPTNSQKPREYYELILVHSQSIELTRYISKEDETLITHSTLQIVKVLTPSQWGQDLSKPKYFDIKYEPKGYNYWDYNNAWYYVFGIE